MISNLSFRERRSYLDFFEFLVLDGDIDNAFPSLMQLIDCEGGLGFDLKKFMYYQQTKIIRPKNDTAGTY